MSMSFDLHVKSGDGVVVGEVPGTEYIYVMVEDENDNSMTLYFPNPNDVRTFMVKMLEGLHKVEQGDIPYSVHNDRIEVQS